jgi:hypothetical protein
LRALPTVRGHALVEVDGYDDVEQVSRMVTRSTEPTRHCGT